MFFLGLVLLIVGLFFSSTLMWIGVILMILGALFGGVGYSGYPIGGRRHWF